MTDADAYTMYWAAVTDRHRIYVPLALREESWATAPVETPEHSEPSLPD